MRRHEDVAPELVGAERMAQAGRVVSQREVLPVIGVGGEQGNQDGKRHHDKKKAQADEGELVFLEVSPGILKIGLGLHGDKFVVFLTVAELFEHVV